ncbi:MAG: methionine ABC transporter ATP-binding protein [Candidatus Izemoplasmatales bacterium]
MIKFDNITKTYQLKNELFHALNNVSFEINQGDIFGIIGMSGAGKTTILHILSGLLEPTSGHYIYEGKKVYQKDEQVISSLQKQIGVVFQGYQLLMQQSVYENIAFVLKIRKVEREVIREKVLAILKKVGLEAKANQYPSSLSGGEKQRVAIARALVIEPKLLLLDEPTSALDSLTTKEIIALIRKIHSENQLTICLITHELNVARLLTNRLLVIEKGKVIEMNDTEVLFNDPKETTTKLLLGREV